MKLPYPHPSVRAAAQSPRAVAAGLCHVPPSGGGWESWEGGSHTGEGSSAQPDRDITRRLSMRDGQELPHTELKPGGKATNEGKIQTQGTKPAFACLEYVIRLW